MKTIVWRLLGLALLGSAAGSAQALPWAVQVKNAAGQPLADALR